MAPTRSIVAYWCILIAFFVFAHAEFQFVKGGISLDTTDPRLSPKALGAGCDCSPTGGKYPAKVRTFLQTGLNYIQSIDQERSQGSAFDLIENCTKLHGLTHCIDAEASLRTSIDVVTICVYDTKTNVNLATDFEGVYRQVVKCKPQQNGAAPPAPTVTSSTPVNPTKTPKPNPKSQSTLTPSVSSSPNPKIMQNTGSGGTPSSNENAGDSGTGDAGETTPAPNQAGPPISIPRPTGGLDTTNSEGVTRVNEGCVAIEHLQGYPLQHHQHLMRRVLCLDGFCATPNHALIVNGRWTSLGQLCYSNDQCVNTMKLVNNLDVFKLRRVQFGHFTITPYDIRFPRFAVWIAQAAEKIVFSYSTAALSALVLALSFVVLRRNTVL